MNRGYIRVRNMKYRKLRQFIHYTKLENVMMLCYVSITSLLLFIELSLNMSKNKCSIYAIFYRKTYNE